MVVLCYAVDFCVSLWYSVAFFDLFEEVMHLSLVAFAYIAIVVVVWLLLCNCFVHLCCVFACSFIDIYAGEPSSQVLLFIQKVYLN